MICPAADLSMANYQFMEQLLGLAVLAKILNEQSRRPFRPRHGYGCPTLGAGRRPFCGRRVRSGEATTSDPQSLAAAVTQSVLFRSPRGRLVCSLHSPRSPDPFGNRTETLDSFEHSPGSAEPKISPALLMQAQG